VEVRRDRAAVLFGLVLVVVAAWIHLVRGAGMEMDGMAMEMGASCWTLGYAALVFSMWTIMMAAMMLPSAAPMILRIASPARAASFTAGYLVVWTGFSLAATLLQWRLDRAGMLSETMASRSTALAGLILLTAGLYQLTPAKHACLRHCRSSADCLADRSRSMVVTGMRYGLFCLGCCWVLMGVLFVGGVMDVSWIAALTLLVLVEKALPWGARVGRFGGAALAAWGVVALLGSIR